MSNTTTVNPVYAQLPLLPARRLSNLVVNEQRFCDALRECGLNAQLEPLKGLDLRRSLAALALDWFVILTAFLACPLVGWWLLPVALLMIGNRQLALNNLLHEAAHKNLARRARTNNLLGDWLCAIPALALARYRQTHIPHHRFLGDPVADPDHLRGNPASTGWVRFWCNLVINRHHFRHSVLGALPSMKAVESGKCLGWFVSAVLFLSVMLGFYEAVLFPAVWFLARATVFQPLRMFREMADHHGLASSNWLGYTRNIEGHTLLATLIHPHQDQYHLVHHLLPTIPFYHTLQAHRLLLRLPAYACLHHCDGYFAGSHSLMSCWSQMCGARCIGVP